jgi:hypothetical protein
VKPRGDFQPGQRVEWQSSPSNPAISHGTLIEPDDGLGGPWWLVDVDGETKDVLVKTYALHPIGGIRRLRVADAIQHALVVAGRDRDAPWIPFDEILAAADAVIALDAEAAS